MKKRKAAPIRIETQMIPDGDFFADARPVVTNRPPGPQSAEEMVAWVDWFGSQPETHTEAAIMQVINRYRRVADAETKYVSEARVLLMSCERLLGSMKRGNLHESAYDAMLLQEAYIRHQLAKFMANRRRKGADETNRLRRIREPQFLQRNDRIRAARDEGVTVNELSERFDLSESQIRKIAPLKKDARMR